MVGSPPNSACHVPWLTTATGCAPGVASSASTNVRPSCALTPSTEKKFAETMAPIVRCVWPPDETLSGTNVHAVTPEKTSAARSRMSR